MISWIQNHLIRHGRWIFLTLLALIIVAFVFTIGNTPGCTTDKSAYQAQKFYGVDLNAPRERDQIIDKVSLSSYLNGQEIRSDQQFQSQVMSRIALLHLADELKVPSPNEQALTEYIQTKSAFAGPDGSFSVDSYTKFIDSAESNPRMPTDLIALVLEEDYRIEKVRNVISGPGYLLPSEARAQTQSSQTTYDIATAEISYADFSPEIAPTTETLNSYYEANTLRYEIPERIKAAYVFFPTTSYSEQVSEATEAELRAHFIANRASYVAAYQAEQANIKKPKEIIEGETIEETPSVTFEDVRDAVAAAVAKEKAEVAANEAAQTFAYQLYKNEIKQNSDAFSKLLNDTGVELTPLEPYTQSEAAQSELSKELLQSAYSLSGARYFSDAYPIDGGYAVLIYQGSIAPEIPAFENVKAAVAQDYRAEEKRRLFSQKGEKLKTELESKLETGMSFEEAAAALNLGVNNFETFKLAESPKELNPNALQQAQKMDVGGVSPMLVSNDLGTFVYLESKSVPEIDPDNEDFTQAENFLTYISAQVSSGTLVNELVARGLPEENTPAE